MSTHLPIVVAVLAASAPVVAQAPPFRVGIEMPSQVPVPRPVEAALRETGINYINYYVYNDQPGETPPDEVNASMIRLADSLEADYSIACHHVDPPDQCVRAAAEHAKASGRYRGVVFDEIEHCRLLWPYSKAPLADASKIESFEQGYQAAMQGYGKILGKLTDFGSTGTATHVWPVMHHVAARAGFNVCPKICKEFYSSVSFAIGMGAAKQYGRELWADCDLWLYDMIPGHPAEELKSNLLLAYWLGADLVYIEGAGYNLRPAGNQGAPFSLVNQASAGDFQLTSHGETLRWFCREYLPAHPRPYSFRDVRPNIAIVRFDDTCHGQRYTGSFLDKLYGSEKLRSSADTEAWFGIWNLLTFGKTGRDGLSFFKAWMAPYGYQRPVQEGVTQSYLTRPLMADLHRFFVPLNGVVVYDHLADYDLLKGVPLLFLTGVEISAGTMSAALKCVEEGAVCVAWGPLAARHGFADWKSGVSVVERGRGKVVLTDDFGLGRVYQEIAGLIGRPDEVRYRFGSHEVVLRRVTDNEVTAQLTRQP